MPICLKCNNHFLRRVMINGKKRNLQRRKYCLTCSPFNKHNTKPLHDNIIIIDGITLMLRNQGQCQECGRIYAWPEGKRSGHRKTKCNSCHVNARRFKVKEWAVQYKGGKCQKCGYDKNIHALSFHHLDPATKKFTIGGSYSRSKKIIKEELDKCDIICANCHIEEHMRQNNEIRISRAIKLDSIFITKIL